MPLLTDVVKEAAYFWVAPDMCMDSFSAVGTDDHGEDVFLMP